jgi:predicted nuclease of predicted toxin-antitoxin system
MRLKLDENLPVTAAALLSARGYDVDTVRDEGLTGDPDDAVWRSAQAAARFLATQDLDFSDTRKFAPGTHHGILLVRLPDSEQWRVSDYLVAGFSDPEAGHWARCVVVATPTKVRVIRPVVTDD